MLVNKVGHIVKVSDKLNSKTHPHVFAPLYEKLDPLPSKDNKMFCLEHRVKLK